MTETADGGLWLVSSEGRLVMVSSAYCRRVDRPREALLGLNLDELESVQPGAEIARRLRGLRQRGADHFDSVHLDAGGARVPLLMSALWLPALGCCGVSLRDESHSYARTETPAAEHERMAALLDSLAEGIWGTDFEGRCTYVNRVASSLLGYADPGELLGRVIHDVVHHHDAGGSLGPAPSCRLFSSHRAGQPGHDEALVLRRRDATPVTVRCWTHPVRDAEGSVVGAVFSCVDEPPPRQPLGGLGHEQQVQTLQAILGAIGEAVVTVDAQMRIVQTNEAAQTLFGWPHGTLEGQPLALLLPAEQSAAHDGWAQRWLKSGPRTLQRSTMAPSRPLRARRRDGTELPVLVDLSRVTGPAGDMVVAVVRDMSTELALATAQGAIQARTRFLSRVSHELRTPLHSVVGFAQLLQHTPGLPDVARERARQILRGGEHLRRLVDDLLDVSSLEEGTLRVAPTDCALADLADAALPLVAPQARERGITLHLPALPALAVRADRARLLQVLVNLLANSVKYIPAGGSVWLDARAEEAQVCITVADDGPGLRPDQMALLFTAFERLGAERSGIPGTGLGLAISHGLVRAMGGRLAARPRPGGGLAMEIWLARGELPAATHRQPGPPPRPKAPMAGQAPLDLLYVDDDAVNRLLLQAMTEHLGGVVLRLATSGHEALRMAAEHPPELIFVDLHLGDMLGTTLVQALHAAPATAELPCILLTADVQAARLEATASAGFAGFLHKPLELPVLESTLEQARQRRGR